MTRLLAPLTVLEAVLFVLTMVLAIIGRTRLAGEYVGIAFHLLLLPIIAAFAIGLAGQGAGIAWVACDVIAATGLLWMRDRPDLGDPVFTAVRMAGHLFAAVWIALLSLTLGGASAIVGCALALCFTTYTLAAGRLPQKALAIPGLLLVIWLVLLAGPIARANHPSRSNFTPAVTGERP